MKRKNIINDKADHVGVDEKEFNCDVDGNKVSRHTVRQRLVRKTRRAARDRDYKKTLDFFLELCILEMEGNKSLTEKITPRIIIEIIEAQMLMKKLEYLESQGSENDTELKAFQDRIDRLRVIKTKAG